MYTALQAVASPLGHSTDEASIETGLPSGRRDSNPRPSPWQGDALPTALRPQCRVGRPPANDSPCAAATSPKSRSRAATGASASAARLIARGVPATAPWPARSSASDRRRTCSEVTDDPAALDRRAAGRSSSPSRARATLRPLRRRTAAAPLPHGSGRGADPPWTRGRRRWIERRYVAAVEAVREHIAAGDGLPGEPLPGPARADCRTRRARRRRPCAELLAAGNPAPYAGALRAARPRRRASRQRVAGAVPAPRRDGRRRPGPIKGTGRTAADLPAKDVAENVMIVDLVRNDLGARVPHRIGRRCPTSCAVEEHPGLVHLVSTVAASCADGRRLAASCSAATFPPGSVTGAPKSSALRHHRARWSRSRAGPTAGRSAGSTPTPAPPSWPWRSARSGVRTPTRATAELRHRRRHHLGLRPRREWGETELKAAPPARRSQRDAGRCR